VVGCGLVITCVGLGTTLSLSVFLQPISQAMGWSRTGISLAALVSFLAMGVGSFVWGALSDRFGARVVVLAGGLLLGLGLVLASQARSLLAFQLLFGVIVGAAAGSFYAPLTATTTRWFTRHRTLAVALVSAGIGLGSMTIAPLARWLITTWDWRTAMLVIGDLAWLLVVPAALLLRTPPAALGDAPSTATGPPAGEFTVAEALRSPQLAAIALTHLACCAAHSGPIFHMVTNAIDHGVSPMAATTVLSVAGFASLTGRVVCALVADRVGVKATLLATLSLQALAITLYLGTRELAGFYALSLMFGFAYGGVMPLYAVLVREYFGPRIMGAAFGAVAFASTLGMALGPWVGGWLYDTYGGYFWLFLASFAIGVGAVAIAVTFRPPRARPIIALGAVR
jgi:MFS family permease